MNRRALFWARAVAAVSLFLAGFALAWYGAVMVSFLKPVAKLAGVGLILVAVACFYGAAWIATGRRRYRSIRRMDL